MTEMHLYMGCIGLQEFFILCFLALTIHLHGKLMLEKLRQGVFFWPRLFYAIYVTLSSITVSHILPLSGDMLLILLHL